MRSEVYPYFFSTGKNGFIWNTKNVLNIVLSDSSPFGMVVPYLPHSTQTTDFVTIEVLLLPKMCIGFQFISILHASNASSFYNLFIGIRNNC